MVGSDDQAGLTLARKLEALREVVIPCKSDPRRPVDGLTKGDGK